MKGTINVGREASLARDVRVVGKKSRRSMDRKKSRSPTSNGNTGNAMGLDVTGRVHSHLHHAYPLLHESLLTFL